MKHEFTLQDMRTYLIVGNETNVIYDTISADYSLAYANRANYKRGVSDNWSEF